MLFFRVQGQSQLRVLCRKFQKLQKQPELFLFYFLHYFCSGVVVFVYSVSEPEQNFLLLLYFHYELVNVILWPNVLEHSDNCFICTTVFRAIKCTSCHGNSSVHINPRAWNMPNEGCGTVHLMFSMQNKQNFQSSCQFWMGFEILFVQVVEHEKEIFHIR